MYHMVRYIEGSFSASEIETQHASHARPQQTINVCSHFRVSAIARGENVRRREVELPNRETGGSRQDVNVAANRDVAYRQEEEEEEALAVTSSSSSSPSAPSAPPTETRWTRPSRPRHGRNGS